MNNVEKERRRERKGELADNCYNVIQGTSEKNTQLF